jgi:3-hydroxyacyl-[acyl-carrier-protein] dehydratase
MPGVTIIEAMVADICRDGWHDGAGWKNMLIYFMGIDNCKFRRKVVPGDVLRMTVQTTRGKPGGKVKSKGVATVLTGNSPQKRNLLR